MKRFKVFSLLLCVLLLCSTLTAGALAEGEEPVTITVGATCYTRMEPIPWYETEVYKKVCEMANVKIEYIQYDHELFNLALASGDLPDLMFVDYGDKLDDIVRSKIAMDLKPLLAEYAPNMLLDIYVQRDELVSELKGGDDKALYFIAPYVGKEAARGDLDQWYSYNVRWDWYKEIGAPEIHNDQEYIDTLAAMVEAHPTTENGEKVYALGVQDDLTQWYFRGCWVKPVSGNQWTFSGKQYMASYEDGHLINGYTETDKSAYWTDMHFYNELYKRGLLDPDSFTQTSDDYDSKVKAGRYAGTPTLQKSLYNTMVEENPDTLAGIVGVPTENIVVFSEKKCATGSFPTWFTFIPANSKNWKAALRLMNVVHDLDVQRMLWSGIEGDTWNYVDGVASLTKKGATLISNGGDEKAAYGLGIKVRPFTLLLNSFIGNDGYCLDLSDTDDMREKTLNGLYKDFCEFYGVQYPSQAFLPYVEDGRCIDLSNDCGQLVATAMPSMPTDVARILEKCNDIIYRAIPKLVMAENDEEFNKIQVQVLDDLKAAGEADAWAWCQTEYNAAFEKVAPIFAAITW